MAGYVYILASKRNGTLYIGSTDDIARRLKQHESGAVNGFAKRYGARRLVYLESFDDIRDARTRERHLKWWKRAWKINLIEEQNPSWFDLKKKLFL